MKYDSNRRSYAPIFNHTTDGQVNVTSSDNRILIKEVKKVGNDT